MPRYTSVRRSPRRAGRLRALALALIASACAEGTSHEALEPVARCAPLRGGSPIETLLELRPEERDAVVAVLVEPSIDGAALSCTGTLISPELVLTAKHCAVDFVTGSEIEVRFGPQARGASLREPVVDARLHDQLDLAVLQLAHAIDAPAARISPLAPHVDGLDARLVDLRVAIAGYGLGDDLESGTRAYAVAEVRALSAQHVEVQGIGEAGLCFGDSGGPLLARDALGRARVLGVLSEGASSCDGADRFTRLDLAREWLAALPIDLPSSPAPACTQSLPDTSVR